jgi:hypothetical protein
MVKPMELLFLSKGSKHHWNLCLKVLKERLQMDAGLWLVSLFLLWQAQHSDDTTNPISAIDDHFFIDLLVAKQNGGLKAQK